MSVWHVGMSRYLENKMTSAVAAWSRAMRLQERLARLNHLDRTVRYLPGPSWTEGIGHIALLDFLRNHVCSGLVIKGTLWLRCELLIASI
jgi:hypothetical protein